MRISGLVVLCFCLLSVATAGEAAATAFGGCSCGGAEQAVATRSGYSGDCAQQPHAAEMYRARQLYRARQMYGAQSRPVVARRAPYQGAQVPRYGGIQIVQRPAVQYWTYRAQQARARQVSRTQRQPSVAYRAQRQPVEATRSQAEPALTPGAPHAEAKAPHYALGGGYIIQHPAVCPPRLFCGGGASMEVFAQSIRALWS